MTPRQFGGVLRTADYPPPVWRGPFAVRSTRAQHPVWPGILSLPLRSTREMWRVPQTQERDVKRLITLTVNGTAYEVAIEPRQSLLQLLREELHLTGTKEGCSEGECGACTVLLDGKTVDSCLIFALEAQGRDVTTIEGLAQGDQLHPVQKAFAEYGAVQCGFCTPGMILAAKALLDSNPHPTETEIRQGIAGNLCRCTGYVKIVEAIQAAARG